MFIIKKIKDPDSKCSMDYPEVAIKIAEMVFDTEYTHYLNTTNECWVVFFDGKILWFTDKPNKVYEKNSYHFKREIKK